MLKKIKNLVFDLDDTLYPKSLGLGKAGWAKLETMFLTDKKHEFGIGDISLEDYNTHGDDLLRATPDLDWDGLMNYICEVDVAPVKFNRELKEMLEQMPYRKILYTNADYRHMDRVLDRLGVNELFEHKFTCFDGNFYFKPMAESFEMFFKKLNVRPEECAFFEDNKRNLEMAKQYGMVTVLISESGEEKPEYCDFVFKDVVSALEVFA